MDSILAIVPSADETLYQLRDELHCTTADDVDRFLTELG